MVFENIDLVEVCLGEIEDKTGKQNITWLCEMTSYKCELKDRLKDNIYTAYDICMSSATANLNFRIFR